MTTDRAFDLSAYFARIGYDGPRTPTLETLRAIQCLHPQAITFENLNPLLAIPVRLDIESLEDKLIRSQRGGYCFEHNGVLLHALRALGFRVTGLAARVVWNQPDPSATPARSHMVLKVDLQEGTYIADVGFGMSPTAPLRLVPDIAQETPHESFRLLQKDGLYTLQCNLKGAWTSFYLFDLQEQAPVDYQVANHYVSTWPTSHFVTSLVAARATADGRYGLRNNKLSIHRNKGESEQRMLTSAAEMRTVLGDLFGVAVPEPAHFDSTVERLKLVG